jgi:hypothetical protein
MYHTSGKNIQILGKVVFYNFSDFWGYNRIMIEAVLVYIGLGIVIAYIEIKDDILNKKIAQGYNPDARDGDGDGIVQEGTKWERKK